MDNNRIKILYVVRGLPGSGKSTFVKTLGVPHYEADMYFIGPDGKYTFDPKNLKSAHIWCQNAVRNAMILSEKELLEDSAGVYSIYDRIAVSNTFTQQWEMDPYIKMAEEHGYNFFSVVVENRHGNSNIHGVPKENMDAMEKRFELKLR